MRFIFYILSFIFLVQTVSAQQNDSVSIRRVPPSGISLDPDDANDIKIQLSILSKSIDQLNTKRDSFTRDLMPDVLIFQKAVDYALRYNEFFSAKDVADAKQLLKEGQERASNLLLGRAPWTIAKGEVIRGYISKIDHSVQPYGLSIPENYDNNTGRKFRLSLWFHGRGEKLSEVNFMANGKGFLPKMPVMKNTIMLYPYGRYCNGFKFAGEVDVQEAIESVKRHYKINESEIFNRGFSMGGAAVWQFAVHYPDLWLAANPGAGFAETRQFLLLDNEVLKPAWYERDLLHLYDCPDYASNLSNLPVIAYNGDKDLQKQAADVMEAAMKEQGITLIRVTGPNTGHAYHPQAAKTVDSLLAIEATNGKRSVPKELHFTTYTLKYNKMYWLTVDALEKHWRAAQVNGYVIHQTIELKTKNVTALSLDGSVLSKLLDPAKPVYLKINGSVICIKLPAANSIVSFHLKNKRWVIGPFKDLLVKKHNLQGPIDDAFMSAFVIVRPTGNSSNQLFDQWSKSEMDRFIVQWRRQFRGDALIKNDVDVNKGDLMSNLIIFGDAESNSFLAKIKNKLPVKWNSKDIRAGNNRYDSKTHGLIMIYPNPLNRQRYIVINSGFTFREESFLNNAKQVPMLPDWAIIDLTTPPGPVRPGNVTQAGFFGEHWEIQ